MREIKFKGRRLDNGEWEVGNLIESMGEDYIDGHPVDAETVGQFTGLYDAEGMEIYEGDTLRYVREGDHHHVECLVKFLDGAFKVVNRRDYRDTDLLSSLTLSKWAVDGNIHDDDDVVVTKPETSSSEPTIAYRLNAIEAAIKEVRKLMEK